MRLLEVSEIEAVSGADLTNDIGAGALAGGFAGLVVTAGNPVGFLWGAGGGAILGGVYFFMGRTDGFQVV